jgi:hypothetical protein
MSVLAIESVFCGRYLVELFKGGGNFKITVFVGAIPAGSPVRITNISRWLRIS